MCVLKRFCFCCQPEKNYVAKRKMCKFSIRDTKFKALVSLNQCDVKMFEKKRRTCDKVFRSNILFSCCHFFVCWLRQFCSKRSQSYIVLFPLFLFVDCSMQTIFVGSMYLINFVSCGKYFVGAHFVDKRSIRRVELHILKSQKIGKLKPFRYMNDVEHIEKNMTKIWGIKNQDECESETKMSRMSQNRERTTKNR